LNNVVTSTLVFEGDGRIEEYVGGYEDRQRDFAQAALAAAPSPTPTREPSLPAPAPANKKLSYRERIELDGLPARIEALEAEQALLDATIAGAEFYKESASAIASTLRRMEVVRAELDVIYRRWDELDSRQK
jgi:ATP-binding cassette subfamily F protein uup